MRVWWIPAAMAAEPLLLPLSSDPVVGDATARVGAAGGLTSEGDLEGSALAEVALASRVAIGATVGGDATGALLGADARVELLGQDRGPLDLGATARVTATGFDPGRAEAELSVGAARRFGTTRVLLGLTGGHELSEPLGDGEGSLAVVHALGDTFGLGVDGRARISLGTAAEEEPDAEERQDAWDGRAGLVATAGHGPLGAFVLAGVGAVGAREGGTTAGPVASLGVQLSL